MRLSVFTLLVTCSMLVADSTVDESRYEKQVIVSDLTDALQFEILPGGDIVIAEFWGHIKRFDAETGKVTTLGQIPTYAKGEVGLLGMAVAKDFESTGNLYALFCPSEDKGTMRVSRFQVKDNKLDVAGEEMLLGWSYDTEHVFHMGGAMFMDGKGDLYIGNGDNCHWNPGLPVDFREGRKIWDAYRSAANTKDYRGKILRVHPVPGKGYTVPKGNLFDDAKDGYPEIYAMGIRNPFRIHVDDKTGQLIIGDVGPNVMEKLGVSPAGYEEINITTKAANFGWPSFIGPNEAYPTFDFEKNQAIATYKPESPINESPNNTGIKQLPPALPATIWYSTTASKEFPTLGVGGRSIMAGPIYHFDESNENNLKLPKSLDGKLFIYEWMRSWIQTVALDSKGPRITPFVPGMNLRRPVDMKLATDGTLYLIEYGDVWWKNRDSRIVRIVYRRGNRAPIAKITTNETAGSSPFKIKLDARQSTDPDGDKKLRYEWRIDGNPVAITGGPIFRGRIDKPGTHRVELAVVDPGGAKGTDSIILHVGNSRPKVTISGIEHGSFFDWGQTFNYHVKVNDSDSKAINSDRIMVAGNFQTRRFNPDGTPAIDPGLKLMRASTCFACHMSTAASAGPSYDKVAEKYANDSTALDTLAKKILSGTTGVWGDQRMPPHPQHTLDEAKAMVQWVLSLNDPTNSARLGATGSWTAPKKPGNRANTGVVIMTAAYTDEGNAGAPPLRGESRIVLHSRQKKVALYDESHGMLLIDSVEGERGLLGYFKSGDYVVFRDINLADVNELTLRAGSLTSMPGTVELRLGTMDGPMLATVSVDPTDGEFQAIKVPIEGSKRGLVDLFVKARFPVDASEQTLGINWIEFHAMD